MSEVGVTRSARRSSCSPTVARGRDLEGVWSLRQREGGGKERKRKREDIRRIETKGIKQKCQVMTIICSIHHFIYMLIVNPM